MAERPLDEMQELWRANAEIYSILESLPVDSNRLPEIVGFCVLYPLKKHSFDKFERCQMSGSDIGPQDVFLRKGVAPAGYYVGFVWGASRIAQGYLCMALRKQINDACKPGSKLFTRPITKKAVRFVNSNDFINLEKPDDKVGAYELCAATLPIEPTSRRMRNFV